MSLNALVRCFAVVFAAELGDKTQLAVLSLAATSRAPWSVFLGATLGLAAATGIAVAVGSLLGATLPERWIRLGAGLLFMAMGHLDDPRQLATGVSAAPRAPRSWVVVATSDLWGRGATRGH